ncbi:hypothetical protein JGU71_28800 [Antrihabitans sp. YC3-6]|uniref:Uncharacterized protein n=1 Tax=Antrihabitans stalagmiti TaxID=2799499 RepID=A0A934NWK5_9NOCA|nr:hypothetical protein [Antrihabitans stalagmiti]MBJ8342896.1 hypothetical protein [Antrihabitans stalagmiti]
MSENELDDISRDFTQFAASALQSARKTVEMHRRLKTRRERTVDRKQRTAESRVRVQDKARREADREQRERERAERHAERAQRTTARTEELGKQWSDQDLAARWAVAESLRDADPETADAWSQRMREDGIDPDAAIALADAVDRAPSSDETAAEAPAGTGRDAGEFVAELLAESLAHDELERLDDLSEDRTDNRLDDQRIADLIGVSDPAWLDGEPASVPTTSDTPAPVEPNTRELTTGAEL